MCSNRGLYSWDHVTEKIKKFIVAEGPVIKDPKDNTRIIKKAARFLGIPLAILNFRVLLKKKIDMR